MARVSAVALLALCATALLGAAPCAAEISATRSITAINGLDLDIEIDGCKSKDKYGCKSFTTDWGKNISGNVHANLKRDLDEGSHFVASMHIKTGLFPLPFKVQCKLCNARCGFKIPVLEKDLDIEMPPCPITAGEASKKFNEMIPDRDPVPLKLGVDGIANVYDHNGDELAAVHFSGRVSNDHFAPIKFSLEEGPSK
ncbi:Hypothetical Protein FCC1311_110272 [Hondaea fermentalgiana]|uniref:Uncharacterized protein n=1 Tax=Hondaea fermentalgiana TaxID=2315210 RepID=A0A2R5GW56_9STRA|nr:Hypothetical Protein FCC1311_110272 [Hondaea fermentalgiana]|eukprot:GBG34805.1 Hypothetical Protein FCC1311_110272 [Hondaea fermentalgiana]